MSFRKYCKICFNLLSIHNKNILKKPKIFLENKTLILKKLISNNLFETLYYLCLNYDVNLFKFLIEEKIELPKLNNNNVKHVLKILNIKQKLNVNNSNLKYLISDNYKINNKIYHKYIKDDINFNITDIQN